MNAAARTHRRRLLAAGAFAAAEGFNIAGPAWRIRLRRSLARADSRWEKVVIGTPLVFEGG